MPVSIPVSTGELVDKVTILEIKSERIADEVKLANVRRDLAGLSVHLVPLAMAHPPLEALKARLREINETLWDVEDDIRDCERRKDFGPRFVELARSVYRTNDRRAALKREVDLLTASDILEEKSYAAYE
jgi:hypothetical protein